MGFDLDGWTVRVLEDGLPPLPERVEPSQTVPVAVWRGERHGAVLFVRMWRNGNMDSDCALSERRADGGWMEPSFASGSPWIDDPLVRPDDGWEGEPVLWLGESGMTGIRAIRGAASKRVSAIELQHGGRTSTVPIDSPCGAFVVGIESPGPATLRAVDIHGRPLSGAMDIPRSPPAHS